LDGDTLLLEYSLGAERSFLWAVDHDSLSGFVLPPRAEIETAARAVCSRLGVVGPAGVDDRAARAQVEELSRVLLGPAAGRLGRRRLVVVADGELHYLPFAILREPASAGAPLLAVHEIVNVPSASVLAELRRSEARRGGEAYGAAAHQ